MLLRRISVIVGCFTGCVVGGLLGLVLTIKTDLPSLAMLASCVLPTAGCYAAGLRLWRSLAEIMILAAIGWGLVYAFPPGVSQSAVSKWQRIAAAPLAGYDWLVVCGVASSLLALVGATFAYPSDLQDSDA